ncbi:unnamed protein product [Rotaria sp. Silwood1]|nr:unnamed protein product [Rotaria sp. Silwood1]CAF1157230.1 unnamed protein product [Rotaria sp. Silwood1]CAF3426184.1 unnamed protein product [Rotaria sp. Silwood1]CAF3460930.1 unnamed protein product [Rotaria sp. Silwood1]CAF3496487.1 unnamed protein product [Rotaria sp. Silwood1]
MSNDQTETLEERLDRRRRLHKRRFLDNRTSVDESEIKLINRSPKTTQSLDRQSSKRIIPTTFINQHKKSLPIIENSYSKLNHILSSNQNNSTALRPQLSKNQFFDAENEKQVSSKSLSIHEQQQNEKLIINKNTISSVPSSVISSTTNAKSIPIQQDIGVNSSPSHDEKSVITKENPSSIFLPMVPLTNIKKSNSIVQESHENPTSNSMKELSHTSFDYPVRHLRSNTDSQQYLNFTALNSKPISRTKSEQILLINKSKQQPYDSKFSKLNLLALSYVFNRRMVNVELAPTSPFNNEQSQRKTVWD